MSRIGLSLLVLLMVSAFAAAPAVAADLVSLKLCLDRDFDPKTRECAPGKAMDGTSIVIEPGSATKVYVLSGIRSDEEDTINHVWVRLTPGRKAPLQVYDGLARALRSPSPDEKMWLAVRGVEPEFVATLNVQPARNFRTRSARTLNAAAVGAWKVLIFDSTRTSPLGEIQFEIRPGSADVRTSN